jgi:hypothetical protein
MRDEMQVGGRARDMTLMESREKRVDKWQEGRNDERGGNTKHDECIAKHDTHLYNAQQR